MVLTNRILAIFAIWVTAILLIQRKQVEDMLKKLPQQILHFQEIEDKRISEEIHEDLAQSIAGIKIFIQSTFSEPFSNKQTLNDSKTEIFEQLNKLIEKARELAYGLYPSSLYTLGLTGAIRSLADHYNKQNKLNIKLSIEPFEHLVKKDMAVHFYRIVQEALGNIEEHAQADLAELEIRIEGNTLRMIIKDNGKGFVYQEDPYRFGISIQGLGLAMTSERAKLLGGKFLVISAPEKGTMIELLMPCNAKG